MVAPWNLGLPRIDTDQDPSELGCDPFGELPHRGQRGSGAQFDDDQSGGFRPHSRQPLFQSRPLGFHAVRDPAVVTEPEHVRPRSTVYWSAGSIWCPKFRARLMKRPILPAPH